MAQLLLIKHYTEPQCDIDNDAITVGVVTSMENAKNIITDKVTELGAVLGMAVQIGFSFESEDQRIYSAYVQVEGNESGEHYRVEPVQLLD